MSECEWNPVAGTAANVDEPGHGQATVCIGDGEWHLCASCATLPKFARYKKSPLRRRGAAHLFGGSDEGVSYIRGGWECKNGHIHASGTDATRCEQRTVLVPPPSETETT